MAVKLPAFVVPRPAHAAAEQWVFLAPFVKYTAATGVAKKQNKTKKKFLFWGGQAVTRLRL